MAENITAKIQVRRGELDDLPTLAEGELGYALDDHRLFIGNTPITFTGDGVTTRFNIQDRTIISSHLLVTVDSFTVSPEIDYQLQGTDIVFAQAPELGATIVVSFNTEITTQKNRLETLRITLNGNQDDYIDLGLNFSLLNYNTAIFEYSMVTRFTPDSDPILHPNKNVGDIIAMKVGTLRIIADGVDVQIDERASGLGYENVEFDAEIIDDRVHLKYINQGPESVNFYYNAKLWNTI